MEYLTLGAKAAPPAARGPPAIFSLRASAAAVFPHQEHSRFPSTGNRNLYFNYFSITFCTLITLDFCSARRCEETIC